jgi:predicted ATPase
VKIVSIKIKNYRLFESLEIRDIPAFCVIIGANGTGKSTLFDIFGFLRDALKNNIRQALQIRGGYNEVVTRGKVRSRRTTTRSSRYFSHQRFRAIPTLFKPNSLRNKQNNQKYRDPDRLNSAKQELKSLVGEYYPGTHSKAYEIKSYCCLLNGMSSLRVIFSCLYKVCILTRFSRWFYN